MESEHAARKVCRPPEQWPITPIFAGGAVESAQVVRGTRDVTDQPLVGHSARGAHGRRRVIGVGTGGLAGVQVRDDDLVAVDGKAPHELLRLAVVAGHVMNPHDACPRTRRERYRPIRLDAVTTMARDGDGFGLDRVMADVTHRVASRSLVVISTPR